MSPLVAVLRAVWGCHGLGGYVHSLVPRPDPPGPGCSDPRGLLTSAFFSSLEFYIWMLGRGGPVFHILIE